MKEFIQATVLVLGLLKATSILIAQESNANTENAGVIVSNIDSIMKPVVNTNNYAGNVLISKYDSVLFNKSYGMMNEEQNLANSNQTKFMLASVSMIFTATAIMKLVDEGKISTSDKLEEYFPDFKNAEKITIHHMLAQRSGIRAWDSGFNLANFNRDEPHTVEELIDYFEDDDLLFEPGSKYNHGRSEYILLVAILEKVTGKSFDDYLQDDVFAPLGMRHTGHFSNSSIAEEIPDLANGYTEKGFLNVEPAPSIHWSVKTGHASIYSTVEDMLIFGNAVMNGLLLSQKSWNQILSDYGEYSGYGWFLNPHGSRKRFQMNGRSPGFASYFGVYPDEGLIVIMLSNRYVSLPFFIGPEIAAATFGEPFEVLNLSLNDIDQIQADTITGHYSMGPDFYRPSGTVKITYRNGRLLSGGYPLIPVLDNQGIATSFIHRHYWSRLRFSIDENGTGVLKFDNFVGYKQGIIQEWKWMIISIVLAASALCYLAFKKFYQSPNN